MVITVRDSYRLNVFDNSLMTKVGKRPVAAEAANSALVTQDFVEAVRESRQPAISGESVLPAMRVLQAAQDRWDVQNGAQSLPGRPL